MFYVNNKNFKNVFLYDLPHDHVFYHTGVPYTIDVVDGKFQLIRGIDSFELHGTFVETNQNSRLPLATEVRIALNMDSTLILKVNH